MPYETEKVPFLQQLRASVLNALTDNYLKISPERQRQILSVGGSRVPEVATQDPTNPFSVVGRGLVGAAGDIGEFVKPPPGITALGQRNELFENPNVRELIAPALGVRPEYLAPKTQQPPQPQQPQQPPQTEESFLKPTEGKGTVGRGSSNLGEILLRMGIPLGAVIAGSVNPNFLSSAAGLSTGYAKGISSAEDRVGKEKEEKVSANIQKQRMAIKSARNVIGVLKQTLSKIQPHSGVVARVAGAGRSMAGAAGLDADVSTYNNLRKSILGQLAKIVSGESGRLTDQDIARIEAAVPRVTDTAQEREIAFALLEQILGEQERIYGFDDRGDPYSQYSGRTASGVGFNIRRK